MLAFTPRAAFSPTEQAAASSPPPLLALHGAAPEMSQATHFHRLRTLSK